MDLFAPAMATQAFKNIVCLAVILLCVIGGLDSVYQFKAGEQRTGGRRTAAAVLAISALILVLHNTETSRPFVVRDYSRLACFLSTVGTICGLFSVCLACYGRRAVYLYKIMSKDREPHMPDYKIPDVSR